ncbi:hypothetical protein AYI69_g6236 [Smittium culicis]|uniref:Uncharacterized protein n=1 Tax=Smittium culicis TaxID=133412 RepID=A0A1R1Y0P6_9FUNG|nr:hypothetical protein AYI69_g6236 [Smittium culicis]
METSALYSTSENPNCILRSKTSRWRGYIRAQYGLKKISGLSKLPIKQSLFPVPPHNIRTGTDPVGIHKYSFPSAKIGYIEEKLNFCIP